jgi:hypothetical protein
MLTSIVASAEGGGIITVNSTSMELMGEKKIVVENVRVVTELNTSRRKKSLG